MEAPTTGNEKGNKAVKQFSPCYIVLFLVITPLVSVAYGSDKPPGTVVRWGCQRSVPSTNTVVVAGQVLNNVVSVSAGSCLLALKNDGTVFGYGNNSLGQATGVPSSEPPYISSGLVTLGGKVLSNVVAVSAGGMSYAVKRDGTVVAWGDDRGGRLAMPASLSNITSEDNANIVPVTLIFLLPSFVTIYSL